MKIDHKNSLIQWAEFGGLYCYPGKSVSLCEVFWRALVVGPLKFAMFVVLGVFAVGVSVLAPVLGVAAWIELGEFEFGFFIVPFSLLLVLAICLVLVVAEAITSGTQNTRAGGAMREMYRGWKGKYCPTIEIIERPSEAA